MDTPFRTTGAKASESPTTAPGWGKLNTVWALAGETMLVDRKATLTTRHKDFLMNINAAPWLGTVLGTFFASSY